MIALIFALFLLVVMLSLVY